MTSPFFAEHFFPGQSQLPGTPLALKKEQSGRHKGSKRMCRRYKKSNGWEKYTVKYIPSYTVASKYSKKDPPKHEMILGLHHFSKVARGRAECQYVWITNAEERGQGRGKAMSGEHHGPRM